MWLLLNYHVPNYDGQLNFLAILGGRSDVNPHLMEIHGHPYLVLSHFWDTKFDVVGWFDPYDLAISSWWMRCGVNQCPLCSHEFSFGAIFGATRGLWACLTIANTLVRWVWPKIVEQRSRLLSKIPSMTGEFVGPNKYHTLSCQLCHWHADGGCQFSIV